ncbi:MAG TPA: transposase [Thermodesulfobacteriota bacterium]|nr:transposase [Thermodesulfobacteriota bacterium]
MKYNSDIHHRKSIRLRHYDYSKPGAYFITICTHNRECLFGKIIGRKMVLNNKGKITRHYWLEIPRHFPNVVLDEYIIMPNHVHGIIVLDNSVGARHAVPLHQTEQFGRPTRKSIPTIIRSFKSAVTHQINQIPGASVWQHNYYEHIIRNEIELNKARGYIVYNPINWSTDENYRD